jgi:excisionase family DNA binding protein
LLGERSHAGRNNVERTPEATRKFEQRHRPPDAEECRENGMTISDVARDLGISRMPVYRLLREGKLRRFKGRIAESSFEALLRDHPDAVPY